MELMTGTTIYWFTSIGLMIGLIIGLVIGEQGISLTGNLIWGAIGANLMGYIGIVMGIGDGLLFSVLATIPLLFLANVFHQHHGEELFGEYHPGKLVRKK